jgi:beta-lactamase class A
MNIEDKSFLNKKTLTLLIFMLVLSNIITGYLYFNYKKVKDEPKNEYPLIDYSRNFTDQKNFIVNLVPLKKDLEEIVAEKKDMTISLYIEFLNTGANININIDTPIWPASLIKLPVVMAAAKKVEKGNWSWTDELTLTDVDKDSGFGDLYVKPNGTKFTVEKLVEESFVNSDNTAHLLLARNIDQETFFDVGTEIGIDLFDSNKKIRAKDYARILRSLYYSSFLKRENSQKLLEYLTRTNINDYLSKGIPAEIKFAHKMGRNREQKVFADAGIVYIPGKPYLINVIVEATDLNQEEEIEELFNDISKKTFNYFSQYDK